MESAPEPRGAETVWMFRRALAFVHLWAFGSLWTQLDGLIGPQGIRPAGEFVERARAALTEQGDSLWTALPTLAWFTGAGPTALHLFCAGGMLAALVLLFVDAASTYALATLYLLYLSLFGIASEFLHYQWDILLLEVTFAALFYTPRIPRTVWLPRLIAFKHDYPVDTHSLTAHLTEPPPMRCAPDGVSPQGISKSGRIDHGRDSQGGPRG